MLTAPERPWSLWLCLLSSPMCAAPAALRMARRDCMAIVRRAAGPGRWIWPLGAGHRKAAESGGKRQKAAPQTAGRKYPRGTGSAFHGARGKTGEFHVKQGHRSACCGSKSLKEGFNFFYPVSHRTLTSALVVGLDRRQPVKFHVKLPGASWAWPTTLANPPHPPSSTPVDPPRSTWSPGRRKSREAGPRSLWSKQVSTNQLPPCHVM
jgi:hypothetical protein